MRKSTIEADLQALERICHDAQRFKAFTNVARHSKSDRARLVKIVEAYHKNIEEKKGHQND